MNNNENTAYDKKKTVASSVTENDVEQPQQSNTAVSTEAVIITTNITPTTSQATITNEQPTVSENISLTQQPLNAKTSLIHFEDNSLTQQPSDTSNMSSFQFDSNFLTQPSSTTLFQSPNTTKVSLLPSNNNHPTEPFFSQNYQSLSSFQSNRMIKQPSSTAINIEPSDKEVPLNVCLIVLKEKLEYSIKISESKNSGFGSKFYRNVSFSEHQIEIRKKLLQAINVIINEISDCETIESKINNQPQLVSIDDESKELINSKSKRNRSVEYLYHVFDNAIKDSTFLYRTISIKELKKLHPTTSDGHKVNLDDYTPDDIGVKIATDQHFLLVRDFEQIFGPKKELNHNIVLYSEKRPEDFKALQNNNTIAK